MKEKIERFSKGDFEYELPFLCLSEEIINISVEAGKVYEGSFSINNSQERSIKGIVFSSCRLVKLQDTSFTDVSNIISYQFNATYLKAGDEIQGEFNIISDIGELSVPFLAQIEAPYCETSMGKIRDLFQFTNLARMDWSDAKRVFRLEDFEQIFLTNEPRFQMVYRNLIKSISTSQALEEFLVTIRKKNAIHLEMDKTEAEYHVVDDKITGKLTLTKNQWGYAEIRVSTDSPFIQLEQKFLWADRFIGNTYQITYIIDPQYLRYGNNFGHIWIKTAHQTLTLNIVCKYMRAEHKTSNHRLKQKYETDLTDIYLSFRLNRIGFSEYLDATEAIIAKLPGPEVSYLKDLMKTYLAIVSGKNHIAEELLSDFAKEELLLKKSSVLEYCAYLYLKALYYKDEAIVSNAFDTIRKIYSNGHPDWRILWFLLYTDKRYEKNRASKLSDIREQFNLGCKSPILYYEVVSIFNEEPYLLRELTDFEIQALNFGIKNWIVSMETAKQYTYLAGKIKTFKQVVFNTLVKLYDEFDNQEILSVICSMLIKGMKKSEKYFEWYRLGVEAQLRITELYEFYMHSISDSMQDNIAQPVLLYFIYNSSLSDKQKAFLYASIVKHKNDNESIYRSYYKKIEVFVLKMLEGHYINRDIAILYKEFFRGNTLDPNILTHLPYVMYRHEIICNNPNMVSAVAIHKELGTEEYVGLTDGRAYLDIYTGNSEVFLIDAFGNRYADSIKYTIHPLMNPEDYEDSCVDHSDHPFVLLHLFHHYQNYRILHNSAIELRKRVLMIEGLSKEFITDCYQILIDYYYENYNYDLLEHYLKLIDLNLIRREEWAKYIEIMLTRDLYTKVLDALENYGFDGVPINRLVKLCSGWLKTSESEKRSDTIVTLCYYVFAQGKYDEVILRYLINYYHGSTRDMHRLWQAARGFDMECHNLEERLLSQILFTEEYLENSFQVFKTYYKEVTNYLLVKAYLSFCAYRYLVHKQVIDEGIFLIIKHELFYEENDVCLLAWLKFHASDSSLAESERVFAEYNIQRLVKKGIILPYFTQYRKILSLPERILDKYIVSYRADPKKRIFIHYRLADNSNQEYITERLPNRFMGIHTKEFVIFYHEELQYYITEEFEEETIFTENFNVRYECDTPEDESNYSLINQMLMAQEIKDESKMLDLMKNYAKMEFMISSCFKQID